MKMQLPSVQQHQKLIHTKNRNKREVKGWELASVGAGLGRGAERECVTQQCESTSESVCVERPTAGGLDLEK